jgi:acyl-CoA synthetase (AMP-forming)/AMP-acid ligase II
MKDNRVSVGSRERIGVKMKSVLDVAEPGLLYLIKEFAAKYPSRPACTFLDFREGRVIRDTVSYSDLLARATALGASLSAFTDPGDCVVIALPKSIDYVLAFLACMLVDRVAVPLQSPDGKRGRTRIISVLADAYPTAVLATAQDVDALQEICRGSTVRHFLEISEDGVSPHPVSESPASGPSVIHPHALVPAPDDDRIAYLQYTSGSTSSPRGVVVSHRHLAANLSQLARAFPVYSQKTTVAWLPFFHDMGLVVTLAAPLYVGGHSVFLSPSAFVRKPSRWLWAMSEFEAGFSATPNFGLDMAVRWVPESERASLDLSCLEVMFNGSEPVRSETLRSFSAAYRTAGFSPAAHCPAYGLAEATVFVSGKRGAEEPLIQSFRRADLAVGKVTPVSPDRTPAGPPTASEVAASDAAASLVGCGVSDGCEVAIVDPDSATVVSSDSIGEIWVSGPNVCDSYLNQPDESAQVFHAKQAGEQGAGHWLRTGDSGFFWNGELFITSRLKDLIIVGGVNIYPADVEGFLQQSFPQLRAGRIAALGIDRGPTQTLTVLAELAKYGAPDAGVIPEDFELIIARAVAAEFDTGDVNVFLVSRNKLHVTTSGKIMRSAIKEDFLNGRFAQVAAGGDAHLRAPR